MKYLAFDVETTGLDAYRGARTFAYAICDTDGKTDVIRFDQDKQGKDKLQELFTDTSIIKIAHNYHFELSILICGGIYVPNETVWHDTMIISQMIDNLAYSHALDELAFKWGGYTKSQDIDIDKAKRIYGTYDKIPVYLMDRYQRADVERTMLLFCSLFPLLQKDERAYKDYLNEIALVKTTIQMEMNGIQVDTKESYALIDWMEKEVDNANSFIQMQGYEINLNSPKQLSNLLFNELKFKPINFTSKNDTSTGKDTIEVLRQQTTDETKIKILDCITKMRSYTKGIAMINSYLEAAPDGVIYPHINTNRAKTGRQSSENPNMQNISKEAALKNRFPVPARKCFRARVGHIWYLGDYAGIEMRLIIEHTKQPELMKLIKENGDPHKLAASIFYKNIWGSDAEVLKFAILSNDKNRKLYTDDVNKIGRDAAIEAWSKKARKILRTSAKNTQFALAYGAGFDEICNTLVMSQVEAMPGVNAYKERFPEVANFTKNIIRQVKKYGFVTTSFGRKLYVPVHQAFTGSNYLIQGTAAGILKRAQIAVNKYFNEQLNNELKLLLPIHDELIIEVPRSHLYHINSLLVEIALCMTSIPEISVPLEIEWKRTTKNWNDAKEIKIN